MENHTYGGPTQFGYELIRDHVLPSILGKHEGDILYWAGKEIARKFPVFSMEEIPSFFLEAGWGQLQLEKTSKKEAFYQLISPGENLKISDRNFQLEAGFLAEQYQKLNGMLTECYADSKRNDQSITFHLAWDKKETV
ncbi:YslB family protein [Sporosarcina ureilytica]|uniref:YslB family protein n=1 Tax=Sporosarcina ureilytica TaxID=298596 RepID=UPI00094D399F|nr:YslB family protein [Sporosarcina ureilytica]